MQRVKGPGRFTQGNVVPSNAASFSSSGSGAVRNALGNGGKENDMEVVAVHQVDRATYQNIIGRS
jgi:hypothetical protein